MLFFSKCVPQARNATAIAGVDQTQFMSHSLALVARARSDHRAVVIILPAGAIPLCDVSRAAT